MARETARAKNGRRNSRRRQHSAARICIMLGVLLFGVLVTLSLTVFFKIAEIQVTGDVPYAHADVLEASGVREGHNLLVINAGKLNNHLTKSFPYIQRISLKRSLPSKLVIQLIPAQPAAVFKIDGGYCLVDNALKVLEISEETAWQGIALVVGAQVTEYGVGAVLTFDDIDRQNTYWSLMTAMEDLSFSDVTEIDLTDAVDIHLIYQNRVDIKVGLADDLEYKLQFAQSVLNEQIDANKTGVLDLSMLESKKKNVYFRPGDINRVSSQFESAAQLSE